MSTLEKIWAVVDHTGKVDWTEATREHAEKQLRETAEPGEPPGRVECYVPLSTIRERLDRMARDRRFLMHGSEAIDEMRLFLQFCDLAPSLDQDEFDRVNASVMDFLGELARTPNTLMEQVASIDIDKLVKEGE